MKLFRHSQRPTAVEADVSTPYLCMRLMHSADRARIEAVQNELIKAGIATEARMHPIAEKLGLSEMEIWVQNEQDFLPAAELYARMEEQSASPGAQAEPPPVRENGRHPGSAALPPAREDLERASQVLEQEVEGMLERENGLLAESAVLRGKIQQLERALAEAQTAITRETNNRAAADRSHTERFSRLESTLKAERAARAFAEEQLGRERREWQQHLKTHDESLKEVQKELEKRSQMLQTQEAAVVDLRTAVEALASQRDEVDKALSAAREEAASEREARLAAEARAEKTAESLRSLEQQLLEQRRMEHRMEAHLSSIKALCSRLQAKRVALVEN